MRVIFGHIGSDAGYWYIGADGKIHRVPGWNPEALVDLSRAVTILGEAGQLKAAGLGASLIPAAHAFVHKEVGAHLKEGDVLVLR